MLCRFTQGRAEIPVIPFVEDSVAPMKGAAVVLLGYPDGAEGLVGRLSDSDRSVVMRGGDSSVLNVAQGLADRGAIRPLPTQGIVGDVTPNLIVHTAATNEGGSGSPLFERTGRMIGINVAMHAASDVDRSPGDSKFAIPSNETVNLLRMHNIPRSGT